MRPSAAPSANDHDSRHMPGLDMLRAIAILLVIPRHAWEILKWPSLKFFFGRYGWTGVDLFFVLSGFLIGGQIFQDVRREGRVSFRRFYVKRSFRILPSYLVVLLLYLLWPAFRETPEMQPLWRFLTFTMNLGVPRGSWAFSHAWSLCIEEHFYLVFPAIVAASVIWPKLVSPIGVFWAVILGGAALRFYLWTENAPFYPAVYRPTYARLDGLSAGVALAALREFRPDRWRRIVRRPWLAFIGGILMIVGGCWAFGDSGKIEFGTYVLSFPLISFGFAGLVVAAVSPGFWLAHTRIRGISKIAALAYTLYLTHKQMIHLAVLIIGEPDNNVWSILGLSILLIVAASLLLHYAVEQPFLKWRNRILLTVKI